MSKSVWFILIVLSIFLIGAASLLWNNRVRDNYIFTGFILLLFVTIYSVSVLGYRITGSSIGIEEARKEIEASKKEISAVATALLKITYLAANGSSRWGGIPKEHLEEIQKIHKSLGDYIPNDVEQDIKNKLSVIDAKIESRNKEKK